MISYLKGTVKYRGGKSLILEVNQVGYQLFVSDQILYAAEEGGKLELFTHLYVRETAMELYGFSGLDELEFFQQLIAISGVGPKSAIGVLSVAKLGDIKAAIVEDNPRFLTKVSGIGKKTAERIIVELKGKVAKEGDYRMSGSDSSPDDDVVDALVGLGYKAVHAREAVNRIPEDVETTEERIREALRLLGKK